MQILSDFGILSIMILNLIKRKQRRAIKLELKPRDQDISLLKWRLMQKIELWLPNSQINSTLVDYLLAFHPDQDNVADAMATFLKEKNLSSIKRKWRRRRVSEQLLNELFLFIINPRGICSFSYELSTCKCAIWTRIPKRDNAMWRKNDQETLNSRWGLLVFSSWARVLCTPFLRHMDSLPCS